MRALPLGGGRNQKDKEDALAKGTRRVALRSNSHHTLLVLSNRWCLKKWEKLDLQATVDERKTQRHMKSYSILPLFLAPAAAAAPGSPVKPKLPPLAA